MDNIIKILETALITHDVLRVKTTKPVSIAFTPGQAADISINKPEWKDQIRSFTFTSLNEDDYLEFNIKTYPSHHGVTEQLLSLKPGDELIIHAIFGTIVYKGEGLFIAGGAGVTPFIAIFRRLEKDGKLGSNKLLFANKTKQDIIQHDYFTKLLKSNFINVLSEEKIEGQENGYITTEIIKKYSTQELKYYYVCGPDAMMNAIQDSLLQLGISKECIVYEKF